MSPKLLGVAGEQTLLGHMLRHGCLHGCAGWGGGQRGVDACAQPRHPLSRNLLPSYTPPSLLPLSPMQEDPIEEVAGINVVPNTKQQHEITVGISNSFGFGGHNSVCAFAPFKA